MRNSKIKQKVIYGTYHSICDNLTKLLNQGWVIKHVTSSATQNYVYVTFVLEFYI